MTLSSEKNIFAFVKWKVLGDMMQAIANYLVGYGSLLASVSVASPRVSSLAFTREHLQQQILRRFYQPQQNQGDM